MYFIYTKYVIKSQLQYRISTYLLIFAQFFAQFFFILSFYYLFAKFKSIKGYSYNDIILIYGIFYTCFSIADMISRGIIDLPKLIRSGSMDIFFIRPRNLLLQVIGSNFEVSRIGRLVQAIAVLIYGIKIINIKWNLTKIIVLTLILIFGIILFFTIFLFLETIAFWSINDSGIINIFSDSGKDIFQYPVDVFNKGIRLILTYVLPFAFINYYPILYLLGKTTKKLYAFSPIVIVFWFLSTIFFWKIGVKNYSSTGS